MTATVLKAPRRGSVIDYDKASVFLAGSIDMGAAVDWQTRVSEALEPYDITVFNPRRDDWDSSWRQSIDDPQFNEQVTWELDHLESANLIVFYFDPNGQAPITLLELGLYAVDVCTDIVVCCPEGYWRKGNVDVVCRRYGVTQVEDLDSLIEWVQAWVEENQ